PNTAQDAFSAKETPVASKASTKTSVVETVEPPTSARSTARPVREKPIVAEAPRRSAPVLPVREAQAGPAAPEDEPPFDPQDDLFDGRAQEPFPGAFAGARGAQKPAAKAQPEAFFKADEVVYETALHIADEEDDEPLDEEEDFILPSPEDFDAPEEAEEEYIPGSRLIEKEHVYKNEPAQPLSSYSAEKEMRAPIHTDMLLHEEEEAQDEPVDIPTAEPKSSSLFGDRLRRANAAYDAQKAAQSAPAEQSAPRSPMGSGLASGPENVPFSQNEIFGVHKSAAQAAPEPPPYNYPPVDLLAQAKPSKARNQEAIDLEKGRRLVEVLLSFGITTKLTGVSHGPTVTRFELAPAPGIKVSRITSLVDDIALGLAAKSVRIEAPIPGKPAVGVEVPNDEIETVQLRDVLESPEAQKHPSRIAAAIGRDNAGRNILCDLAKMPHILIAGATGAGKSVCINCIICSILYRATPEEVRLIMIDPKMVELSVYNEIPHLLVPVVTDPKKAAGALEWVVNEMTQRYRKFAASGTKDIKGYNLKRPEYEPAMPQIVVIIDELADLMMVAPGDVEDAICRIAQLARAAGIHLVIATQRPSVNVITGVIKANIPSRIAFTVASQVDSRTILDIGGAEKLLGRGDMLYAPSGTNKPQRVQGAWISENEVQAVVQYIRDRHEADYSEDLTEHLERADMSDAEKEEAEEQHDDLLPQAIEFVVEAGQASISMLQRKMRIGYARAGRLIDEMARRGFISEADGAKPREVLITREQFRAMFKE
ncbi:MAG: DNA translocase FtsK, partial [Eubacteriales bacterium]|nr:DNA translocase FtsK [Eubacteriales bacterium]